MWILNAFIPFFISLSAFSIVTITAATHEAGKLADNEQQSFVLNTQAIIWHPKKSNVFLCIYL